MFFGFFGLNEESDTDGTCVNWQFRFYNDLERHEILIS